MAAVLRGDGGLNQGLAIAFAIGLAVMLFGAAIAGRLQPDTDRGREPALR